MRIFVKTLTGRRREFTVEGPMTVLQLKQQLQEKEGIDVAQIRLIFNGKQLVDDQLLESYGVKASEVVHMVLALRG